jgi:hypothetical protein
MGSGAVRQGVFQRIFDAGAPSDERAKLGSRVYYMN